MSDRIEAILRQLDELCCASPALVPEVRRRWDERLEAMIETHSIAKRDTTPETQDLVRDPHATIHTPQSAQAPTIPERATSRFRFNIREKHREGGLGVVYHADDTELKRSVALKQIKTKRANETHTQARFIREAEITGNLEHPGIVPIYSLGNYADGTPFYAMRFIEGRTLSDAIAEFHGNKALSEAQRTVEFRKLLTRFIGVCQALAFAHSKNVLHRDLKPDNIMLGEFGETLVVDWGLAKRMQEQELAQASSEGIQSETDEDGALSYDGGLMGTPHFMPPEQARGEFSTLTPAADIYSLGATLYVILTGKAPFSGKAMDVIEKVKTGEFESPRSVNTKVPKALDAICLKAMAKTPADRYATSKALAEELEKHLADEPVAVYRETLYERTRRWMRKHPAIVTSTAVAMVLGLGAASMIAYLQGAHAKVLEGKNQTIGGQVIELTNRNETIEKQKTDLEVSNKNLNIAKQKAEDRERDAINAVKRFGDVVANTPELKNSPQLEALRGKLLQEPLEFFKQLRERLQNESDGGRVGLEQLAGAAFELAVLTEKIGDQKHALAILDEARIIYEGRVNQDSTAIECQTGLAATYYNIGIVLNATGKPTEALAAHKASKAIQERLSVENPNASHFKSALAMNFECIANILGENGDSDEAQVAYEAAKSIQKRLMQENPTITDISSRLSSVLANLGNLLFRTGKVSEAIIEFEEAKAIGERLVREFPTVVEFQDSLASIYISIGAAFNEIGNHDAALTSFEKAREIRERLALENPTVIVFQDGLARTYVNLGNLLRATGKSNEAVSAYDKANSIREMLVKKNPTMLGVQESLASGLGNLGLLLSEIGKHSDALRVYERVKLIRERLVLENPTSIEFKSGLAMHYSNTGILLNSLGKPAEAVAAHLNAKQLQQRLVEENPSIITYRRDLSRTHYNLGNILRTSGNSAEALTAYNNAKEIMEGLARENPTVVEFRRELATVLNNLGLVLSAIGKLEQAEETHKSAIKLQERVEIEDPGSIANSKGLALSYFNLGNILHANGKLGDAIAAFVKAKEIQSRLARANPQIMSLRRDLALSNLKLGILHHAAGNTQIALSAFEEAKEVQEILVQQNPTIIDLRSGLGLVFNSLAMLKLDNGDFLEAKPLLLKAIEYQSSSLKENPGQVYYRENLKLNFANLQKTAIGLRDAALEKEARLGLLNLATSDPSFRALDKRLAAVASGSQTDGSKELLMIGQRAYDIQKFSLAARFFGEALVQDARLSEDRDSQIPYNAACSAALAADGKSIDEPPLDDAAKTKLRSQALTWLKSELTQWQKFLGDDPTPEAKKTVAQTLAHWQQDSDLASIRDADKLVTLPEAERKEWEALWAEVNALQAKVSAEAETPPVKSKAEPVAPSEATPTPDNPMPTPKPEPTEPPKSETPPLPKL